MSDSVVFDYRFQPDLFNWRIMSGKVSSPDWEPKKMNAREMRMFSTVCKDLEEKYLRLAEKNVNQLPFDPIEVAAALSVIAGDFLPGPVPLRTT
ncbi:hypothetical protein [Parasedimentitalea denitrificans]|uniref:hypothetical protein n=1 Tax=Parasedimentitalea denitrificans TaxID=2211118 RepID=UPI00142FA275|nr:hypothetical protein [Sedimentitalea sp. CY04]